MVNDPQQIILFRNVRDTIVWYLSHPFFRRNVCAARRIFTPWGKSHENKRFILVTSSPNSAGRVLASRDEEVFRCALISAFDHYVCMDNCHCSLLLYWNFGSRPITSGSNIAERWDPCTMVCKSTHLSPFSPDIGLRLLPWQLRCMQLKFVETRRSHWRDLTSQWSRINYYTRFQRRKKGKGNQNYISSPLNVGD